MEETTRERTSAFIQPNGTINKVLVKYVTKNAMGDVLRPVETRASKKRSTCPENHFIYVLFLQWRLGVAHILSVCRGLSRGARALTSTSMANPLAPEPVGVQMLVSLFFQRQLQ